MISVLEDERLWLQNFSSQDLARTLVREYLYQHNMFKTLNCFEIQDKANSKKIIKSTVVKMLCINNLLVNNKKLQKQKQAKSLLLLLVQYLRGKFQDRIKRQDYSEHAPQNHKNQKQFSMNGDKLFTKEIFQGNVIKEKNLVNTNRKEMDAKITTQENFYKKKGSNDEDEDLNFVKKSSNAIKQDKKSYNNSRPSTANPMLQPKNQEKQKIQGIYSKINTQNVDKVQEKNQNLEKHSMSSRKNLEKDDKKVGEFSKYTNSYGNSAIGRNNKLQSSGDTKQLRQQKEEQNQQQKKKNEAAQQTSKSNTRYVQLSQKQFKSVEKKVQSLTQTNLDKLTTLEQNEVQQEYFDEFQDEKPQKVEIKKKTQQISQEKNYQLKVENNSLGSNKKQVQTKIEVLQQCYQPSNTMRRGGNKLVRKGQDITKQQNTNEMIEKDAKLLQGNIKTSTQKKDTEIQISPAQFIIEQKNEEKLKSSESKKQFPLNTQQQPPPTTVRQIKLKKKAKNIDQQPKITSKFKFDDNFIDEPLHGKKQKYLYEKFSFLNMVIKEELKPKNSNIVLSNKINYMQKLSFETSGGNPYAQGMMKKKNEKPLSTSKGNELKKIVFGQASPYLPKAWHQGFILSPFADTFYGLKQIQGGPCGIIAAVQCYFLKHLLYLSKASNENDLKNNLRRQVCLVAALSDILWKVKGKSEKIILIIPSNRNFSGPKLQISNLTEVQIDALSFESFYETFWSYKNSFIGQSNHGVTAIIYSIVMTKGIDKIYNEVDMKQNPLIGNHGHCTQELVNLFITGQASSNCFDGKKELQDNFTLHGISQKSQFGFLTVYETLGYLQVGKNLKNPIFPIWIISKEFHYHVIFGNHYLIAQNNDCQKFDLIYFDGLYTCDKYIRLTFDQVEKDEFGMLKDTGAIDKLPLIQQVLLKKWGKRKTDWNGSTRIL